MPEDLDFTGKVVLLTGGSRGIGRAACLKFGRYGARVALNYRSNRAAAEAVVSEITAGGGEAIAVAADITNTEQVQAMVKTVLDRFGQIDILVNNAGGSLVQGKTIVDTTDEEWNRNVSFNLLGPFLVTRAVVPHMIERRQGRIINTSSGAAWGGTSHIAYSAAKAGILGFTRSLAQDLSRYNIQVTCVVPPLTDTDGGARHMSPERIGRILSTSLFPRIAEPEEVADLMVFLASPMARRVSSAILDMNGRAG